MPALVYGAAMGGWSYLILDSLLALLGLPPSVPIPLPSVAVVASTLLGAAFVKRLYDLDRTRTPEP